MKKIIFVVFSVLVLVGVVACYIFSKPASVELEIHGADESIQVGCAIEKVEDKLMDGVYVTVNGQKADAELVIEDLSVVNHQSNGNVTYVARYGDQLVRKVRPVTYAEDVVTITQKKDFVLVRNQVIDLTEFFEVHESCPHNSFLKITDTARIDYDGHYNAVIEYNGVSLETVVTVLEPEDATGEDSDDEHIFDNVVSQGSVDEEVVEEVNDGKPTVILKSDEISLHVGEAFNYRDYLETIEDDVDTFNYLAHYIRIHNNIDSNNMGDYTVKYLVTNSRGYVGEAILKVKVVE